MHKNTLLIAITAGFFATTGAFAQTPSGNSSSADSTGAAQMQSADTADAASMPKKKHHMTRKHASSQSSTGESANPSKTPAVETGASAATENGQSK
jgi:hypothetical protein